MKAKLVWIKKFKWDEEGKRIPIEDETWWKINPPESGFDENLYEPYVLIPVEVDS